MIHSGPPFLIRKAGISRKFIRVASPFLLLLLPIALLAQQAIDLKYPSQEDVDGWDRQAKIAVSKKQIRESETPDVTALSGTTDIDSVNVESTILAYRAAGAIAKKIRHDITEYKPCEKNEDKVRTIVFHDDTSFASVRVYETFLVQARLIEDQFEKLPLPKEGDVGKALIPEATGFLKTVVDLLALFRENFSFKGVTVAPNQGSLAALVAGELIYHGSSQVRVLYPARLSQDFSKLENLDNKPVMKRLKELADKRQQADIHLKEILDLLKTLKENPNQNKDKIDVFEKLKASYEAVNAMHDAFISALTKVEETTGASVLALLLRAGWLVEELQKAGSYTLHLDFAHAGGTNRARQSLWRFFWNGAGLDHSGGAVVSYLLFNRKSELVLARTLDTVTKFVKLKGNLLNNAGDNFKDIEKK